MVQQITLQGVGELKKKFGEMIAIIDDRKTENELLKSANILKNDIKRRAPKGPTGNLKRSIVARIFKRKITNQPAAFVAVDYRIAPHAHLVEYGHGGPHPASAHPFFRSAIDALKNKIVDIIEKGIWRILEEKANK